MFAGNSAVFRSQTALQGAQYQNVWMYVVHEMEEAIKDCFVNQPTSKIGGLNDWDEAWAFYCGSKAGPSGAIRRGKAAGWSLWTLAQKRCLEFGTCQRGRKFAKVNVEVMKLFKRGMKQLNTKQCNGLIKTKEKIVVQMTAPLIQGILRYAVLTKERVGREKDKAHASGWALVAAALPLIDRCDRSVALLLDFNFSPNRIPMRDSIDNIAGAVHQGVLSCLGLNCRCIGTTGGLPRCVI